MSTFYIVYICQLFILHISQAEGIDTKSQSDYVRFGRQLQECNPRSNEGCEQFFEDEYPSPLEADHKCENYDKYDRGDEVHVKRLVMEENWLQQKAVGGLKSKYNNFFYVNGTSPEQEFLLCTTPKTGVTRAKMLIMRINDLHGHVHPGWNYKEVPYTYAEKFSKQQKLDILFNPDIPRIKLVRNPYIRAISGYQDKMLHHNYKRKGKYVGWNMVYDQIPTFEQWVDYLYYQFKNNKYIDSHFAPQYDRCWENFGLKFDYILKVEQMKNWFPCFVEQLNLWQYVMKGWPEEDNCFLSTPDVECDGPEQTDTGNLVYNETIQGLNHQYDAFQVVKQYYKNETTAKLVTEIFLNDIVQYDYPFWSEMTWDKYSNLSQLLF
eukprot:TRINITY_DN23923_c0_g1_i4.p1 TRINITY_DN23923_c0_g1~~TRINITY_DN23923_c0_g1_i4.p1  ORF type:complete len:378 (-),score=35.70 TRINITY_DN23923_c0_g1_i4:165-1298(-)